MSTERVERMSERGKGEREKGDRERGGRTLGCAKLLTIRQSTTPLISIKT